MQCIVLVLSFSNLDMDPRVTRHIRALQTEFQVAACGLSPPKQTTIRHFLVQARPRSRIAKLAAAVSLLMGGFDYFYWSHPYVRAALPQLDGEKFDAILANDILSLPLALRVAKGAPVVFDAHEYSPGEYSESWFWRTLFLKYIDYQCRAYMHLASACITVCHSIAETYQRHYGVTMSVIDNAAPFQDVSVRATKADCIRMIHHGAALPARHLERMIEVMDCVDDRYTLDFMLIPDASGYLPKLKKLAAGNSRIHFRDPVPASEIVRACAHYDIGLYLLEPINLNHQFALPNKIFEFIQARLAVVIGPSPEMAGIVKKHGCGVVADSFKPRALAEALNRLSNDDIDRLKKNSDCAARLHNAESGAARLRDIVRSAIQAKNTAQI